MTTATATETRSDVIAAALRRALADSYALLARTHGAHWNVTGPAFFGLHEAFEVQYRELFEAVDELAERLRAVGAEAPGSLEELAAQASLGAPATGGTSAERVKSLIRDHEAVVLSLKKLREVSGDDEVTDGIALERLTVHEKTLWMLKSVLD